MRSEKSQREGRRKGERARIDLGEKTQGSCDLVTISSHRALCKQDSQAQEGKGLSTGHLNCLSLAGPNSQ